MKIKMEDELRVKVVASRKRSLTLPPETIKQFKSCPRPLAGLRHRGRVMGNARLVVLGAVCLSWCALPTRGDYKDLIGFTALKSELGPQMPTGAGVPVVHAEPGVPSIDPN